MSTHFYNLFLDAVPSYCYLGKLRKLSGRSISLFITNVIICFNLEYLVFQELERVQIPITQKKKTFKRIIQRWNSVNHVKT